MKFLDTDDEEDIVGDPIVGNPGAHVAPEGDRAATPPAATDYDDAATAPSDMDHSAAVTVSSENEQIDAAATRLYTVEHKCCNCNAVVPEGNHLCQVTSHWCCPWCLSAEGCAAPCLKCVVVDPLPTR